MSDDQIAALRARLAKDPAFAAALNAATSRAEVERVLAAHGWDTSSFALDDLSGLGGLLTDEGLEAVVGADGPHPHTSSLGCTPTGPGPQTCSW